jgi:hypothetical protein
LPDSRLIGDVVFYRRAQGKEAVDGLAGRGTQAPEAAARAEADRLRSWIEELSRELARAEEQVSRLVIAAEEVARVLELCRRDPASSQNQSLQDF